MLTDLSFFQINVKVKQNSINVIFAVTAEQKSVYEKLGVHIEGSTSGTLLGDSGNIVTLVQEQYNVSTMLIIVLVISVCSRVSNKHKVFEHKL